MDLLKDKNILSRREFKSILNNYNGWYSSKDFAEILRKERHRSDRTGLPISYILIDLSEYSNNTNGIPDSVYQNFLKELIVLITQNTRDFDVKYFCHPSKIGTLLIDTALNGARAFVEKIFKKLYEHFESQNKKEYVNIVPSIAISSYPLSQAPDCDRIKATPVVSRNSEFEKEMEKKNYELKSSSNGTIALTAPDIIYENENHLTHRFFKPLIDVLGSLLGIILFSPLMIIISIAIRIASKGPILFKQKRVGYLGKTFTLLKFRTMRIECDDRIHKEYVKKLIEGKNDEINLGTQEEPLYKLTDDPRVTFVGKILRKTSLDELPQLFNVLMGSMSLVGPRPPIPYEVEAYQSWHWRRILEAKPGITGLWQVNGRSKTTFDEMVRLDLRYVNSRSIFLDIKILLKTFVVIFNFNPNGAL